MLAIGAAAASDTNDNLTADKQDSLSLNVDKNVVSNKNLDVLKAKDNESTLRASGSFSDLEQYINTATGSTIELPNDYQMLDSEKTTYANGIVISKSNIVIDGKNHKIDAAGLGRIFQITGSGVTLKDIDFMNAYSQQDYISGVAINWAGDGGKVTNCDFTNNVGDNLRKPTNGGAIYWSGNNAVIEKSTFTGNAAEFGGALNLVGQNARVTNCVFTENRAYYSAGGVYTISPNSVISNCDFNANTGLQGGAVWFSTENAGETITIEKNRFVDNEANMGGAIFADTYDGLIKYNNITGLNQIEINTLSDVGYVTIDHNEELSRENNGYTVKNNGRIYLSDNYFRNTIFNTKDILSKTVSTFRYLPQIGYNGSEINCWDIMKYRGSGSFSWEFFAPYEAIIYFKTVDDRSNTIVSKNMKLYDPLGNYTDKYFDTQYSLLNTFSTARRNGVVQFAECNYLYMNFLIAGTRKFEAYDPGFKGTHTTDYSTVGVLGSYTHLQLAFDWFNESERFLDLTGDYVYWAPYDGNMSNPYYGEHGLYPGGYGTLTESGVNLYKSISITGVNTGGYRNIINANNQSGLINVYADDVEISGLCFMNTNPFVNCDMASEQPSGNIKQHVGIKWYGDNGKLRACSFNDFYDWRNSTNLEKYRDSPNGVALNWYGADGLLEDVSFSYMKNPYRVSYGGWDNENYLTYRGNMVVWSGHNARLNRVSMAGTEVSSCLRISSPNAKLTEIYVQYTDDAGTFVSISGSNTTVNGLYTSTVGHGSYPDGGCILYVGTNSYDPTTNITIKRVISSNNIFTTIEVEAENVTISDSKCYDSFGKFLVVSGKNCTAYDIDMHDNKPKDLRRYSLANPIMITVKDGGYLDCYKCNFTSIRCEEIYEQSTAYRSIGGLIIVDGKGNLRMSDCKVFNYTGDKAILIQSRGNINISNTTFVNIRADEDYQYVDSAFMSSGNLTLDGCLFKNFNVTGGSGALEITGRWSYIKNTTFINCTGDHHKYGGGAILFTNDIAKNSIIDNCTFNLCDARFGGAIYLNDYERSNYTFSYCTFINNSAYLNGSSSNGGAIYRNKVSSGTLDFFNVTNCIFIDNKAEGPGSAIWDYCYSDIYYSKYYSRANILNSVFINNGLNKGHVDDVSILSQGRNLLIQNCSFNNTINTTFFASTVKALNITLINNTELNPRTTVPLQYNYTYYPNEWYNTAYRTNDIKTRPIYKEPVSTYGVFSYIIRSGNTYLSNNSLNNTIFVDTIISKYLTGMSYYNGYIGDGPASIISPTNLTYMENKTHFVAKGEINCTIWVNITDDAGNKIVTNSRYVFYDNGTKIKYKGLDDFLGANITYDNSVFFYKWAVQVPTNITLYEPATGNPVFKNANVKKGYLMTMPNCYTWVQMLIDNATEGSQIIISANVNFDPDYDLHENNPYAGIINFTNGILVNKTIIINGRSSNTNHYIDGKNLSRIFNVVANGTVIKNIGLRNGNTTSNGAAIFYNNTVNSTINTVTFNNNYAVNCSGGAIYYYGCVNASVLSSTFNNNRVINGSGGAIFINGSDNVTIKNCKFTNNVVINGTGGAIYALNSKNIDIVFSSSSYTISSNSAVNGSGIVFDGVIDSKIYGADSKTQFKDNVASDSGFIYITNSSNIDITKVTTNLNHGINVAGFVIVNSTNVLVNKSSFYQNNATGTSDLYVNADFVSVIDAVFERTMNTYTNTNGTFGVKYASNMIYWAGSNGLLNNTVIERKSGYVSGYHYDGSGRKINEYNFLYGENNLTNGDAIIWDGDNGTINNCDFKYYDVRTGYQVLWNGNNGTLSKSTFECNNTVYVTGSLALNNNTETVGYYNTSASVYNTGNISLSGNNFHNTIYNINGKVISPTYVTVINNKTYQTNESTFLLFTNITDDMDNIIVSNTLKIINVTTSWNTGYDSLNNYYNWTTVKGENRITASDDGLLNATLKPGLVVCKNVSSLPIIVTKTNEGQIVVINATLQNVDVDNETMTISVNGKEYNCTINNNTAILTLYNLTPGVYRVTATFAGNESVFGVSNTRNFTVDYLNSTLNITAQNITLYGEKTIINFTVGGVIPEFLSGTVSILIDDATYNVNITDKSFEVILPRTGVFYITGIYNGNEYYKSSRNTTRCEVVKRDTPISIENRELEVGENVTIEVVIDSHATGNVTISVNGVESVVPITPDHKARLNISRVIGGTYHIKATYDGNDICKANSTNTTFIVAKKALTADLNIGSKNITVTFSENITGQVLFDINGTGYWANIINGTATIPIPNDLKPGTYNITASFKGDEMWNDIELSELLVIPGTNTTLIVIGSDIFVGDNETIYIIISPDAKGNVTLYINNNAVHTYTELSNVMSYSLLDLAQGKYDVRVEYTGDGIFLPAQNTTSFLVYQESGFLFDIIINDTIVGGKTNVTVTVPKNATGNISIDGYGPVRIVNGSAVIEINAGPAGKNSVAVKFIPDEGSEYVETSRIGTYNVAKLNSSIYISDVNITRNNVTLTVVTPNTNATILINGKQYEMRNGKFVIPSSDLSAGNYSAILNAIEDDLYIGSINVTSLEIPKIKSSPVFSLDSRNIVVTFDEDVDGEILFDVNGTLMWAPINGKVASIELPDNMLAGTYDVVASFKGNDKFDNFTIKQTVDVLVNSSHVDIFKLVSSITLSVHDIRLGETEAIKVNVTRGATGYVLIKVNGKVHYLDLTNSEATLLLKDITKVGNYSVEAIYSGDAKYRNASTTGSFVVSDGVIITVKKDANGPVLEVIAPEGATGNITVCIDGKNFTGEISDGRALIKVPGVDPGNYTVDVYATDSKGGKFNLSADVSIPSDLSDLDFAFIATVIDVNHINSDLVVTCVLKDIDGNVLPNQKIEYVMNGVNGNTVTDSKGLFNVTCVDNSVLYVEYAGNNVYSGYNTTVKLDKFLNARAASKILSDPFTSYAIDFEAGERGQYFKFRVVDADGNPIVSKPVKIGFSGVVYDRVTDADGYAQLQINLNTPFIFTFAIGFLGDDDYNASFVVQSITVKKKTTSLSAPSKSFKASAKTKSYTVTLKAGVCSSIDGKAYLGTNKVVQLKVDGKTYNAKVNANGQATFKLKMSKKGTYKAAISYAGNVRYDACKTTSIIKIK